MLLSFSHVELIFTSTTTSAPFSSRLVPEKNTPKFHSLQTLVPGRLARSLHPGGSRDLFRWPRNAAAPKRGAILVPHPWLVIVSRRLVWSRFFLFLDHTSKCKCKSTTTTLPPVSPLRIEDLMTVKRSDKVACKKKNLPVMPFISSARRRRTRCELQLLADERGGSTRKREMHKVQHPRICVSRISSNAARITWRKVIFSGVNYWLEAILARCWMDRVRESWQVLRYAFCNWRVLRKINKLLVFFFSC